MKKLSKIILELIISIMFTLLTFYMLNWYSFKTLPSTLVFIQMIIMVLIIFDLIELFNYGECNKDKI